MGTAPRPRREGAGHPTTMPPFRKRTGLSWCKQHSAKTCCNSTHTDQIKAQVAPMYASYFSQPGKTLTNEVLCSACNGTLVRDAIPMSTCRRWYSQCRKDYFFVLED